MLPKNLKHSPHKLLALICVCLLGCNGDQNNISPNENNTNPTLNNHESVASKTFTWQLPLNISPPIVPTDNAISDEKVSLGRFLFYDKRLSNNQTQSCASCHEQGHAFAEDTMTATGSTGEPHARNSQSLVNTAFNASLTWNNPAINNLEQQIAIPIFGQHPIELGVSEQNQTEVLTRFQQDTNYQNLFKVAFPLQTEPISFNNIIKALASFVRTLNSYNSPFDHFQAGDKTALSNSAQRGMNLFFSERLACSECHSGQNFNQFKENLENTAVNNFHNIGLYNLDGLGKYPNQNQGFIEFSHNPEDMGKFKTPSLRNIEHSAPYMHDGSVATLEDVVDFYAAGGRFIASGDNAGDGRVNPFKHKLVKGFALDSQDKKDLVNFLKSLSDTDFLHNPNFSNPFITQTDT